MAGEDEGDGQAAVLILSDPVRPGAAALVERLHALGVRPVRMLTGDNALTAAHIAREVGIDEWEAELLPHDKVRIVREMKGAAPRRRDGRRSGVGVIGDGVNDAPALAAADVSIAIGSIGSDAALESADIILLSDDLAAVPWAIRLARRTRGIVLFNILFALGVIVGMATMTLVGSRIGFRVPLTAAVIAHEGGTLLVVANSLRLLLATGVPRETPPAGSAEPSGIRAVA
jgi:Cd2+/Zn2+-exporting ATPase